MPSKRKKIAIPVKRTPRARRRARSNPSAGSVSLAPTKNPPLLTDLAEFVAPGFVGYAGTRLVSRITYTQLAKKWPKASRHLAAGSSVASFLLAWYLLHRVERLKKYHTPAAVGAAIAAAQTIVQTYLPKFGWIVSDFQPTVGSVTAPMVAGPTAAQIAAMTQAATMEDDEDDDIINPMTPLPATMGTLAGSSLGISESDVDGLDDLDADLN